MSHKTLMQILQADSSSLKLERMTWKKINNAQVLSSHVQICFRGNSTKVNQGCMGVKTARQGICSVAFCHAKGWHFSLMRSFLKQQHRTCACPRLHAEAEKWWLMSMEIIFKHLCWLGITIAHTMMLLDIIWAMPAGGQAWDVRSRCTISFPGWYSSRACHELRRQGSSRALYLIYGSKCLVLEEDKGKVLQGCLQVAQLGKPVLCCTKLRLYPAAEVRTQYNPTWRKRAVDMQAEQLQEDYMTKARAADRRQNVAGAGVGTRCGHQQSPHCWIKCWQARTTPQRGGGEGCGLLCQSSAPTGRDDSARQAVSWGGWRPWGQVVQEWQEGEVRLQLWRQVGGGRAGPSSSRCEIWLHSFWNRSHYRFNRLNCSPLTAP